MKLVGLIRGFDKTKSYPGFQRTNPIAVVGTINPANKPVVGTVKAKKAVTEDNKLLKKLKKTAVFHDKTIKSNKL